LGRDRVGAARPFLYPTVGVAMTESPPRPPKPALVIRAADDGIEITTTRPILYAAIGFVAALVLLVIAVIIFRPGRVPSVAVAEPQEAASIAPSAVPVQEKLDIGRLITQAGDFPAPYRTRADPMPWRIYPGIPQTPDVFYQEIISGSDERNEVGHITVVHYADTATADRAYEVIRKEAEYGPAVRPLDIGEVGSQTPSREEWSSSDVLFRRCNTIVHATLEPQTLPILKAYAQRLHDRIQPIICVE
jgi:hypothetical protein